MREIEFRGRRLDNEEWVYGNLVCGGGKACICDYETKDVFYVDPATVGQYTGLKDKNGKKIYEGNILIASRIKIYKTEIFKGVLMYGTASLLLEFISPNGYELHRRIADFNSLEVIGNIHDNPELLKTE